MKIQDVFKHEIRDRMDYLKMIRAARDDAKLTGIIDELLALHPGTSASVYAASVYLGTTVTGWQEYVALSKSVIEVATKHNLRRVHFGDFAKTGSASLTLTGYRIGDRTYTISCGFSLSDSEGATCKLVKVGEETVTKPVYKLVCDDGQEVENADVQD